MIHTGLVSVTFRQLPPEEIILLVQKAGLEGIEWGGDIHVPPGDLSRAAEVWHRTEDARLRVAAYGTYYVVGSPGPAASPPFETVLDTALALHAPTLRVWAGERGSAEASQAYRNRVVEDALRIARLAAEAGVDVALEYHENTLTDRLDSALRLLEEVGQANLGSYWQPLAPASQEGCLQQLHSLSPWLRNLHVYHLDGEERRPLAEGAREWLEYLGFVKGLPGEHFCMLEFVRDDSKDQFLQDAETLKRLLKGTFTVWPTENQGLGSR